jgi:hypothetical protein
MFGGSGELDEIRMLEVRCRGQMKPLEVQAIDGILHDEPESRIITRYHHFPNFEEPTNDGLAAK